MFIGTIAALGAGSIVPLTFLLYGQVASTLVDAQKSKYMPSNSTLSNNTIDKWFVNLIYLNLFI